MSEFITAHTQAHTHIHTYPLTHTMYMHVYRSLQSITAGPAARLITEHSTDAKMSNERKILKELFFSQGEEVNSK